MYLHWRSQDPWVDKAQSRIDMNHVELGSILLTSQEVLSYRRFIGILQLTLTFVILRMTTRRLNHLCNAILLITIYLYLYDDVITWLMSNKDRLISIVFSSQKYSYVIDMIYSLNFICNITVTEGL